MCICLVWFDNAMTSDRFSIASVEIDKNYSFTLPRWKSLCHRWSGYQPKPGFFSQRQGRQRRERAWERGWSIFFDGATTVHD